MTPFAQRLGNVFYYTFAVLCVIPLLLFANSAVSGLKTFRADTAFIEMTQSIRDQFAAKGIDYAAHCARPSKEEYQRLHPESTNPFDVWGYQPPIIVQKGECESLQTADTYVRNGRPRIFQLSDLGGVLLLSAVLLAVGWTLRYLLTGRTDMR
jgi:hypothetical protein